MLVLRFHRSSGYGLLLRFSDHCWDPQVSSYSDGGVPTYPVFEHKPSGYATCAFLLYQFKMIRDEVPVFTLQSPLILQRRAVFCNSRNTLLKNKPI